VPNGDDKVLGTARTPLRCETLLIRLIRTVKFIYGIGLVRIVVRCSGTAARDEEKIVKIDLSGKAAFVTGGSKGIGRE
jgi:hypothetical protein